MKKLLSIMILMLIVSVSFAQLGGKTTISKVTGLQTALDAKADTSIVLTQTEADATYLQLTDTIPFSSIAYNKTEVDSIIHVANQNPISKLKYLLDGSTVTFPVAMTTWLTATGVFTSQRFYYMLIEVPDSTRYTKFHWVLQSQGAFTESDYNGFGIYSVASNGTFTKIVETANDASVFKTAVDALGTKALPSPIILPPGVYAIGWLYCSSAQSAVVGYYGSSVLVPATSVLFSNSIKLGGFIATQTSLPNSFAASAATQYNSIPFIWIAND